MNLMEILGRIGFDWRMALSNLINFLIIFWLLKKFAWQKIQKNINERQEKINQGLDDAKKAAGDALMAEENYKARINTAKKEANLIIAKASEESQKIINQAGEEARERGKKIMTETKDMINKEKNKMLAQIRKETIELALEISEKIIGSKIDGKKNNELIAQIIKQRRKE